MRLIEALVGIKIRKLLPCVGHVRRLVASEWRQQRGGESRSVTEDETRQGLFTDVDGEEFAEEGGVSGEGLEGSIAEAWVAIEEQQEGGHAPREGEDSGMAGFVEIKAGMGVIGGGE